MEENLEMYRYLCVVKAYKAVEKARKVPWCEKYMKVTVGGSRMGQAFCGL
ncbi:MAG: hypothetical protein ACLVIY_01965 [Anaerobutyricum soehngenii]